MRISVVVPSYNSSRTIRACLRSLMAQERPADEILVVDSSDDETPGIVGGEFPGVRLIYLAEKTLPGPARNRGVAESTGDVVAMTDADCVAHAGWLAALERGYRDEPRAAAVGGVVGIANPESFPGAIGYILEFSEFILGTRSGPRDTMPTCNLSVRREAFQRHGGFPQDFFPGEDTAFTHRLTRAGELLLLVGDAVVLHHNKDAWQDVYRHQHSLGRAFVASRRCEPTLPGAFLLRHPALAALLPAVRWPRIACRLGARDRRLLWRFLAATPYVLRGLMAWRRGFAEALAEAAAQAGPRPGGPGPPE